MRDSDSHQPDSAPVHFSIDHVPRYVYVYSTGTSIHASAYCLRQTKYPSIHYQLRLCSSEALKLPC